MNFSFFTPIKIDDGYCAEFLLDILNPAHGKQVVAATYDGHDFYEIHEDKDYVFTPTIYIEKESYESFEIYTHQQSYNLLIKAGTQHEIISCDGKHIPFPVIKQLREALGGNLTDIIVPSGVTLDSGNLCINIHKLDTLPLDNVYWPMVVIGISANPKHEHFVMPFRMWPHQLPGGNDVFGEIGLGVLDVSKVKLLVVH